MISSRTGTPYKYIKTEVSKICNTRILHTQKASSSPYANRQSSSIILFSIILMKGKKKPFHDSGGKINMRMVFSQSDHTEKYLPATLNTKAEKAFREKKNSSSQWVLNKTKFQKLTQGLWPVDMDLLAPRLSHHVPRYRRGQPEQHQHTWMVGASKINWTNLKVYALTLPHQFL